MRGRLPRQCDGCLADRPNGQRVVCRRLCERRAEPPSIQRCQRRAGQSLWHTGALCTGALHIPRSILSRGRRPAVHVSHALQPHAHRSRIVASTDRHNVAAAHAHRRDPLHRLAPRPRARAAERAAAQHAAGDVDAGAVSLASARRSAAAAATVAAAAAATALVHAPMPTLGALALRALTFRARTLRARTIRFRVPTLTIRLGASAITPGRHPSASIRRPLQLKTTAFATPSLAATNASSRVCPLPASLASPASSRECLLPAPPASPARSCDCPPPAPPAPPASTRPKSTSRAVCGAASGTQRAQGSPCTTPTWLHAAAGLGSRLASRTDSSSLRSSSGAGADSGDQWWTEAASRPAVCATDVAGAAAAAAAAASTSPPAFAIVHTLGWLSRHFHPPPEMWLALAVVLVLAVWLAVWLALAVVLALALPPSGSPSVCGQFNCTGMHTMLALDGTTAAPADSRPRSLAAATAPIAPSPSSPTSNDSSTSTSAGHASSWPTLQRRTSPHTTCACHGATPEASSTRAAASAPAALRSASVA
eukprot:365728-Chlamydomonas_euryale.AAC.6